MDQNNQFRESSRITPHTRSLIYRAIKKAGEWKGTRRGVDIAIRLVDQPTLDGKRVSWRAHFKTLWVADHALTIRDAIDEIERYTTGQKEVPK